MFSSSDFEQFSLLHSLLLGHTTSTVSQDSMVWFPYSGPRACEATKLG